MKDLSQDIPGRQKSKLDRLYGQVQGSEAVIDAVRGGKADFLNKIAATGLNADSSQTHSFDDLEAQAFILALPSIRDAEEMRRKAYMTFIAHWFDDFVDRSDQSQSAVSAMYEHRMDPVRALASMGTVGELAAKTMASTKHPAAALRGFQRMIYGGLVIQADSSGVGTPEALRAEYQRLVSESLTRKFAQEIAGIRPDAYWLTTKTVQELFFSLEQEYNDNIAEAWSLLYAPALYYHNIDEEEDVGEVQPGERPPVDELKKTMQIGARYATQFQDPLFKERLVQMSFIISAFAQVLPADIYSEYVSIYAGMVNHKEEPKAD